MINFFTVRIHSLRSHCVLCIGFLSVLLCCNTLSFANASRVIQLEAVKVRSAPKLWATVVVDMRAGDLVTIHSTDGGWAKVSAKGKQGYLPVSAFGTRVEKPSGGGTILTAGRNDVLLAGKGFNANTEDLFASSGAQLNYRAVDEVERSRVDDSMIQQFVKQGKLQ